MGFTHPTDHAPSRQGRRSLLLAGVLLIATAATPALAQSIFDRLADGPREQPGSDMIRCEAITLQFSFYDDNRRMALTYTGDIVDYEGNFRRRGDYDVLAVEDGSLLVQLDDESRRDAAGDPVRWRLRINRDGMTCWQRADAGLFDCVGHTVPCPGDVPIS